MKRIMLFLTVSFFSLFLNSQESDKLSIIYSGSDAVFIEKSRHIELMVNRAKILINDNIQERVKILNQEGIRRFSSDYIHYTSFERIEDINAFTQTIYKGKLKNFSVKTIETQSYLPSGHLYTDNKIKYIRFPNVQLGSIINLKYTKMISDPRLIYPFIFADDIPVLKAEFSISYDEAIEIGWKYFAMDTLNIQVKETSCKGSRTITWILDSVPAFTKEEESPALLEYMPHLLIYVKKVNLKNKTLVYLDSVESLYKWYLSMLGMTNHKDKTELNEFSCQLVSDLKTDEEKIKTIFQWVQKNIKYIAVNEGLGGFVPEDCVDVFHNRYGDCKAMANLTGEMLKACGLESHITWIGTKRLPYTYQDNFTPFTDNHMILTIFKDTHPQILDPTFSYGAIYHPPFYLQGKEALISITDSTFMIHKVPVTEKENNKSFDSTYLELNDIVLTGKTFIELSGYKKNEFEVDYRKNEDKLTDFYNEKFSRGNNKTELQNIELKGLFDRENKMTLTYELEISDYVKTYNDKFYLNLNINKSNSGSAINIKNRKYDMTYDYRFLDESIVCFTLPEGYNVEYIPENAFYKNEKFGFEINYTVDEDRVIQNKVFYIDNLRVLKTDFAEWNKMIEELNTAYQEVIIINKI